LGVGGVGKKVMGARERRENGGPGIGKGRGETVEQRWGGERGRNGKFESLKGVRSWKGQNVRRQKQGILAPAPVLKKKKKHPDVNGRGVFFWRRKREKSDEGEKKKT